MAEPFNPYREWLGVTSIEDLPNRYELLGLEPFTADAAQITLAADTAMARVRRVKPGDRAAEWSRILDELARAKQCLLDPGEKEAYDDALRMQASHGMWAKKPPSPATGADETPTARTAVPREPIPDGGRSVWMIPVIACLVVVMLGLAGLLIYKLQRQGDSMAEILQPIGPAQGGAPSRDTATRAPQIHPAVTPTPTNNQPRVAIAHAPQPSALADRYASSQPGPATNRFSRDASRTARPSERTRTAHAPQPPVQSPTPPAVPAIDRTKAEAFARAVEETRAAFAARDLAAARQSLTTATANSQTSDDAVKLERLQLMFDSLTQFWDGVRAAMAQFQQAEELSHRDRQFIVSESGRDHLVLKTAGQVRKFHATELPSWLVMLIADRNFGKDAGSKAIVATFLAVDPYGNRAAARRYWVEAAQAGFDCAKLLPELDEKYPVPEPPTAKPATHPSR